MENKIVYRGWFMVNFPTIIIILGSWFLLMKYSGLQYKTCGIIAIVLGWIYWEITVVKWIKWSLLQGIEKSRLFHIGKRNLLLRSEYKIDKASKKIENRNLKMQTKNQNKVLTLPLFWFQ